MRNILFLLIFYSISSFSSVVIDRALALKLYADTHNHNDIKYLKEKLDGDFFSNSTLVMDRLEADLEVFKSLKLHNLTHEKWPFAFNSSLGKLIGTSEFSGILQDSSSILASGDIPETVAHNKITVLKNLLIYLNGEKYSADEMGQIFSNLRLVFPFELSDKFKILEDTRLANNNKFYVPNAGFVFGGDFTGDKNDLKNFHGTDCSGFIAYVTNTPRTSTKVYSVLWKILKNKPLSSDDESFAIYVKEIKPYFKAIEIEELKVGDLLVTRNKTSNAGHVVLVKSIENDSITTIEDNRADNKLMEGIVINKISLTELSKTKDFFPLRSISKNEVSIWRQFYARFYIDLLKYYANYLVIHRKS